MAGEQLDLERGRGDSCFVDGLFYTDKHFNIKHNTKQINYKLCNLNGFRTKNPGLSSLFINLHFTNEMDKM